ncbi:hypothetical protein [Planomicrobium okeanokoites]|uniref:Uncharacterized protein n=1 Tax=Planomicrobium okeanokoites TaxID=244 RepID=A0ABV7KML0_PLAOK|nr:hypothetical protein [Planomicrobium okeanokoites]TAA66773.1 hypothetical protein D2910_14795 [Planomicrobium okeanokoites]
MLVTISDIIASDKRILSFYDPVPFEALTYEGVLDLEEDIQDYAITCYTPVRITGQMEPLYEAWYIRKDVIDYVD